MSLCVAFTGGGTGGHIYPGLAVADQLRLICKETKSENCRIVWIGSSSGMDKRIVEASGSADLFYGIPSGKLRRYFSFKNIIDIFKIFGGFVKAFFILKKEKPQVLFSKGGFVSVPPCFAAKLLKIPVYTHECDFSPGLATKLNSKVAKGIFVSYQQTENFFGAEKKSKVMVTGNPVRPAFYNASPEKGRTFLGLPSIPEAQEKPLLVVIGGSSGAKQINQLVAETLDFLCQHFILVHQTGAALAEDIKNLSPTQGIYKPYPFIYEEMPDVLAAADLVLSRAGANSIWECTVLQKPMILIPLCGSGTRGDQVENAKFFANHQAALVLEGKEATKENLIALVTKMIEKEEREKLIKGAASLCTGTPPAKTIATHIYSEINKK